MSTSPNTRSAMRNVEAGQTPRPKVKVLLIGVDGLRIDRAFGTGLAPTLDALRENGHFIESRVEVPTISGPGWTSILTGTTHAQHLIRDNMMTGHRLSECPDFLAKAAEADPLVTTYAAAGWPNLTDPAGLGPIIRYRPDDILEGRHHVVSLNGELYGYRTVDPEIASRARLAIEHAGPDLNFVYFCHTDDAGHYFGVFTSEYDEAISLTDQRIRLLLDAVDARVDGHNETWIVAVTTDHGHVDAGGHGQGSDEETQTFLLTAVRGAGKLSELPAKLPSKLEPHEFTDWLLSVQGQLQHQLTATEAM